MQLREHAEATARGSFSRRTSRVSKMSVDDSHDLEYVVVNTQVRFSLSLLLCSASRSMLSGRA